MRLPRWTRLTNCTEQASNVYSSELPVRILQVSCHLQQHMLILLEHIWEEAVGKTTGVVTDRLNPTSQHLPARQPDLISFSNMVRGLVVQRNAADVKCLDFNRALNQIAYDIPVDKMEKHAVHLL